MQDFTAALRRSTGDGQEPRRCCLHSGPFPGSVHSGVRGRVLINTWVRGHKLFGPGLCSLTKGILRHVLSGDITRQLTCGTRGGVVGGVSVRFGFGRVNSELLATRHLMLPQVSTKEKSKTQWAWQVVPCIHILRGLTPWHNLTSALPDHLRTHREAE